MNLVKYIILDLLYMIAKGGLMHLGALGENWFETFYIFKYDFFHKKLILLKFYYLVLDAKLLINHVESFFL